MFLDWVRFYDDPVDPDLEMQGNLAISNIRDPSVYTYTFAGHEKRDLYWGDYGNGVGIWAVAKGTSTSGVVPEPSSAILVLAGFTGLLFLTRKSILPTRILK